MRQSTKWEGHSETYRYGGRHEIHRARWESAWCVFRDGQCIVNNAESLDDAAKWCAYDLGRIAFHSHKPRIPAGDADLMLANPCNVELAAWLRAWDCENVAARVPA